MSRQSTFPFLTAPASSRRRSRAATLKRAAAAEALSGEQCSIIDSEDDRRMREIGSTRRPGAFDFILRHEGDLLRIARREAKGIDADEIASEARIMLIERWEAYKPSEGSPATWIYWQVRAARQKLKRARDSRSHLRIPGDLASAMSRDRLEEGQEPEVSRAVLSEISSRSASSAGSTEAHAMLRDVLTGMPPAHVSALMRGGQAGAEAAASIRRIYHARTIHTRRTT